MILSVGSKSSSLIDSRPVSSEYVDANGEKQEVRGSGVVGEQPVLAPGETFQYMSYCALKTSTGVMRGTYHMVTDGGDPFDVEIAPFALHEPYTVH